ncbi:MAG: type II toxin-antitoxin system death-on-curing family toxin [Bacteroidetes bacterium SW_9_63_38]|nr:MAG: type II toxin-antitoxin system death-on-curing family toxin [Bacteroidetes bacterium SW_9_63_38]
MDVTWLDAETVRALNRIALYDYETHEENQGSDLEGALHRPRAYHFYEEATSLSELAARYAVALVRAHAFQDGNKRTALLSIRVFLKANGRTFDYGALDEEAAEMMVDIATNSVDVDDVTAWIRRNVEESAA